MRRTAAQCALDQVRRVRDDPAGRLALLHRLYAGPPGNGDTHLPYGRAAAAFMGWQLARGVLNPLDGTPPGSPWWRAMNERLLRDGWEARELAVGRGGPPSSSSVGPSLEFVLRPSARNWYRAHNVTIVSAYLENHELAQQESRVERFFLNLILVRVLYAHALVAEPRLALGWLAPIAPALGDPRLGMTGIFLSMARILPDRYPLGDEVERYIRREHAFGHMLDVGVIVPRIGQLFDWSAGELELPELRGLICDGRPSYAWDVDDNALWDLHVSRLARTARRLLPVR